MEFSDYFNSSHPSLPSPDGSYIATLHCNRLTIRLTKNLTTYRTINVPPDFASRVSCIRWSPRPLAVHRDAQHPISGKAYPSTNPTLRILLTDYETVRVWSIHDPSWSATITSAGSPPGAPSHITFGHTPHEILVFHSFGLKLRIWFLDNGKSLEIRDPKPLPHGHGHGYGYRAQTGHFALLTRPAAHDVITLHAPRSYEAVGSFTVPMVDAQGVKWSPDGRWLAVWEAASVGLKVLVYTADGHLYRCYRGGGEEGDAGGLGVRTIEWSPREESLAVVGYDERVTLLNSTTFSPTLHLTQPPTLHNLAPTVPIWREHLSTSAPKKRSYHLATQHLCPLTSTSTIADPAPNTNSKPGTLTFNASGILLATTTPSMPTTLYIWSLSPLAPYAILVQDSSIKSVQWHPTRADLLLLYCYGGISGGGAGAGADVKLMYIWSADPNWGGPSVVHVPLRVPVLVAVGEKRGGSESGRRGWDARWIHPTASDQRARVLCADKDGGVVGYLRARGEEGMDGGEAEAEAEAGPEGEGMFDEGGSADLNFLSHGEGVQEDKKANGYGLEDDSLYDGLEGRSSDLSGQVDDTFYFKRHGGS